MMGIPTAIPLPDRHYLPALHNHIEASEKTILATIYLASPPTPLSSPRVQALHRAILRAPKHCAHCAVVLARHTPTAPAAASHRLLAEQWQEAGWKIHWGSPGEMCHAKMWIIDARLLIAGSHNLTEAALEKNHELSTLITDATCLLAATALWHLAAGKKNS